MTHQKEDGKFVHKKKIKKFQIFFFIVYRADRCLLDHKPLIVCSDKQPQFFLQSSYFEVEAIGVKKLYMAYIYELTDCIPHLPFDLRTLEFHLHW